MNKYENRTVRDLAKSRRFVSLVITTLFSLLVFFKPEAAAYRDLILESMFGVVGIIVATFGLEDIVEKIGDAFYAIWGKANEIVIVEEEEVAEE